jgi:hypothetical protein
MMTMTRILLGECDYESGIECARSHIRILRTVFKGVPGNTCEDFLGS